MNDSNFFAQTYVRVLMVLVFIGVIAALGAYTNATLKSARYGNMGPTTINVRGEGEVLAKPDIGQFSFAVRAEGDTASVAQDQSAKSINEIINYLKEQGVEEKDIKTENYNLSPKYTYPERICPAGSYCPPGEPKIDGYEVSQNVAVKVRDLEKAGTLISGAGEHGATNISSLQFTIDDESELQAEARAKAIEKAKENAGKLAKDLDVHIVRMLSYYEEGKQPPYYAYGMGGDAAVSEMKTASVPSTPTGENKITSTVVITYEIR